MSNREEVTSESSRRTRRTLELLMQLPLDSPPLNSPPDDSPTLYYSPLPPRSPRPFPLRPLQRSTPLTLHSRSMQLHQRSPQLHQLSPPLLHRHSPPLLHCRSPPLLHHRSASEPLRPSLPRSPLPLRPASEPPRPTPPAFEMVIDMEPQEEVNPVQPPAPRVCSWHIFYDEARGLIQWFVGSLMSLCTVTTLGKMFEHQSDHQSDSKKAGISKDIIKYVSNWEALLLMVLFLIAYPTAHLVSLMFTGKFRKNIQRVALVSGFGLCGTLLYWVAGTWVLAALFGAISVPPLIWLKRRPLWGRLLERCQQLFG